jgi:hypothetical protein
MVRRLKKLPAMTTIKMFYEAVEINGTRYDLPLTDGHQLTTPVEGVQVVFDREVGRRHIWKDGRHIAAVDNCQLNDHEGAFVEV